MAFTSIAFTIPQYDQVDLANYWLKAYEQGTTTPKVMATDATGSTTASRYELDSLGFPITAGNARIIPYIDGVYDLWAFPTAAEADANDTTNAIQFADNIDPERGNADTAIYNQGSTGAVDRTVESRLQDSVSVKDFGAVGDGVTDDTAAIQAAFDSGAGSVLLPCKGTFLATDTLTMQEHQSLEMEGSVLNFNITGQKRCLVTNSYSSVRNGEVHNITTDNTAYGAEWQQPICIGFSNSITDFIHDVIVENIKVSSTAPEGNLIFVFGETYNVLVQNIDAPDSADIGEPFGAHWSAEPGGDETQGTGHPNNIVFRNIKLGEMTAGSGKGSFFLSACRAVTIENVYTEDFVDGNIIEVFAGDHGFTYALDPVAQSTGTILTANNVSGKSQKGIVVDMRDTLESGIVWPSTISFDNSRLLARSSSDTSARGLELGGVSGVSVTNCIFDDYYNGVFFNSKVTNFEFASSVLTNSYSSGVDADGALGCENLRFINSRFINNNTNGGTGYDQVFGSYIENILLDGNVYDSTSVTFNVHAQAAAPPKAMKVINNHVKGAGGTPFVFGGSASFGICELFDGNTVAEGITGNIRGGQDLVPYSITAQQNQPIETRYYIGGSSPNYGTYNPGDIIFDETPAASGKIGWVTTAGGTEGTYSEGLTATANGTTSITLSASSNVLRRGDYLTINATAVRVTSIDGVDMVTDVTVPAGSGLAITYTGGTYKTWGAIDA